MVFYAVGFLAFRVQVRRSERGDRVWTVTLKMTPGLRCGLGVAKVRHELSSRWDVHTPAVVSQLRS